MKRKSSLVILRVSPQDKKRFELAAKEQELTLSQFIRQAAFKRASGVLDR